MIRASAVLLLATSAALAAPVPKDGKKEELYYPTIVGAKKVMTQNGPTGLGGGSTPRPSPRWRRRTGCSR